MNTTVLYVDDEDIPRLIFEKSFESKYAIMVAGSGEEALEQISELADEFIVVISDMRMPVMDGIEFITEARKRHDNMACFILTSLDQGDELEQALSDNLVERVFDKPLNVLEIDTAIKEVAARVA